MDEQRKTRWSGGYIRHGKRGSTYVIERWIGGVRYHVSTKRRTEQAAYRELERFEADPAHYDPAASAKPRAQRSDAVCITAELVADFKAWMLTRPERPTTAYHAARTANCLADWAVDLGGRDLRDVTVRELKEAADRRRNKGTRIASLKAFCGYLRREKFLLTAARDPTVDLRTPRRRAAKDTRQVAIDPDHIIRSLPFLPEATRDIMLVRLSSGWHISDTARFAERGTIRMTPGKFIYETAAEGPVRKPLLALLETEHKVGVITKTPIVDEEYLRAAERLRARGRIPVYLTLTRHVTEACRKAGVPRYLNGFIRHTVVSYAIESGSDTAEAGAFVDHFEGSEITRKNYRQIALPKKTVPIMRVLNGGKDAEAEKAG